MYDDSDGPEEIGYVTGWVWDYAKARVVYIENAPQFEGGTIKPWTRDGLIKRTVYEHEYDAVCALMDFLDRRIRIATSRRERLLKRYKELEP